MMVSGAQCWGNVSSGLRPFVYALTLCGVLFSATAQAQSRGSLISRLDALEAQLQQLQTGAETTRTASPGMSSPAGRYEVSLSEIQEELRHLRGEIEEVRFEQSQLQASMTRLQQDMDLRMSQLERTPPSPNAMMDVPVINQTEDAASTDSAVMTAQAGERSDDVQKSASERSPNAHYQEAFDTLNNGNYTAAETLFREFIQENPDHNLIGNAHYWLGETYYVQEQFAEAAEQFRTGFQVLPEGPKAPDNLLRLGMTLSVLERKEEACIIFKQLLEKYASRSKAVERKANNESAKIQCF